MYDVCSKHDDFKSEFREVSKRSSNEVVSRLIFFILFGNFSIAYLRIRKKKQRPNRRHNNGEKR